MAKISVASGGQLADLKTLFNDMEEIYYFSEEITKAVLGGASVEADMELPVISDGVSFNTGEADVTRIRITTNEIWTSKAVKGDPDISFQVASVAGPVNEMFMKKDSTAVVSAASGLVEGMTYAGSGYDMAPKKVTGGLLMFSEDRQTVIALPSVEMYASLVLAEGDNPAYFNVAVTPMKNSEGVDLYVLVGTPSGT